MAFNLTQIEGYRDVFTKHLVGTHVVDKIIREYWEGGNSRIGTIRMAMFLTGVGLKEAKDAVDEVISDVYLCIKSHYGPDRIGHRSKDFAMGSTYMGRPTADSGTIFTGEGDVRVVFNSAKQEHEHMRKMED